MGKHMVGMGIALAALLGVLAVGGCVVYHDNTHYQEKGKPISNRTLDQIECGTTTKSWVLATLGEPSQQSTTDKGVEVLEYRYGRKKDNQFVFVPFVFINDNGEDKQTLYFEISDGIVTNFWKEESKE
jgi:outer membrane protein assembly factor BamE (lipoprotein component of BamABCDE complex)